MRATTGVLRTLHAALTRALSSGLWSPGGPTARCRLSQCSRTAPATSRLSGARPRRRACDATRALTRSTATSLALHPDGTTLLCALSTGLQLLRVRVSTAADGGSSCELSAAEAPAGAPPLSSFADTKCLAFSADGTRLALGSEDGRLRLLAWPSLRCVADVTGAHSDAVSDADFSPDGGLLLTTGNEKAGPASGAAVWRVQAHKLERVCWLGSFGAPAGARVTLRGAKFARDGSGRAFTGANVNGEARIVAWCVANWRAVASRRALSEPLTSLALSPTDGRLVAAGGAEGSVAMLAARTLATLHRQKGAHMVFVTGLAFSPSGATLASLSGDASARCTPVPKRKSVLAAVLRLVLLLLVHACIFALLMFARRRGMI